MSQHLSTMRIMHCMHFGHNTGLNLIQQSVPEARTNIQKQRTDTHKHVLPPATGSELRHGWPRKCGDVRCRSFQPQQLASVPPHSCRRIRDLCRSGCVRVAKKEAPGVGIVRIRHSAEVCSCRKAGFGACTLFFALHHSTCTSLFPVHAALSRS